LLDGETLSQFIQDNKHQKGTYTIAKKNFARNMRAQQFTKSKRSLEKVNKAFVTIDREDDRKEMENVPKLTMFYSLERTWPIHPFV